MQHSYRHLVPIALVTLASITFALLSIAAVAQENRPPKDQAESIQSVISDQISAFQSGDHERAYSHAAPLIRKMFPTIEKFITMVRTGYPMVYDPTSYKFGRSISVSGKFHQELIMSDRTGKQWQAIYTLSQQPDGQWKITGVKINPSKGVSA